MTTWTDGAIPVSDPHAHFQRVAGRLSRVLGAADEATLDVAATTCLEELGGFADVDVAFITLVDDDTCVSDDWHWIRPGLSATAPPVGSPLAATFGPALDILRMGNTLVIDDLSRVELDPSAHALATANGLQAVVIAPVIVGGRLLGVMGLQVFHRAQAWERSLVVQIELLAQTLVQAVSRTRQQGALAIANARARRIAKYIPDGLLLLSVKGNVTWVSPSFCEMSGLAANRILHQSASTFFHPSHRQAFEEQMARAARRHDAQITVQFQSESGDWRWADVALALSSEPDSGVPNEIVISVRDVHERHLREQHLVRQADLDPLTGLANRLAFERETAKLAERNVQVMVAFCDIDDFKTINDQFGHDVGDAVLRAVATAIGSVVRGDDIVARFGGDEFAVVVTVDDSHALLPLGARLLGVTRELTVDGQKVSLSVGVCGPGPASDAAAMRQKADQAMYGVKRNNKNNWAEVDWNPPPG
ncbi:MAG TPA: diguanylate cyclase [Acidimicrobiales bacterium]|nr:diguanylate cyclase [Acidimicrobiales bacterium]